MCLKPNDNEERLHRFETNAVSSCFIACSAIALDSLASLPQNSESQVPSSLRCTSLCLIACLGAPIVSWDLHIEQLGVLFVLLVAAAMAGEHHGEKYVRAADAIFVLLSGYTTILLFIFRAPINRPTPGASLAGAMLAYVGLRAVRAGISHANEATNFTVHAFNFQTPGYALGDGVVAVALAFGGSILACTGTFVLICADSVQRKGTYVVAPVLAMNASLVFVSACIAQISASARMQSLPALFSEHSCSGTLDVCEAAFRARRFHIANSSPASLWAGCVATAVLAMPKQRICDSRRTYYSLSKLSTTSTLVASLVVILLACTLRFFTSRDSVAAQVELAFLFASILVAWFGTTWAACGLNVTGSLLYIHRRMAGRIGFSLFYFTHWSILVSVVVFAILGLNTLVQSALYAGGQNFLTFDHGKSEVLAPITGFLAVGGFSVQLLLTLLTFSLLSGYDGEDLSGSHRTWIAAGYDHILQHCVTLFFCVATYGVRYETGAGEHGISTRLRRAAWFTLPCIVFFAWSFTMLGEQNPYKASAETWGFTVGIVCAVIPWIVTGMAI